jgi:signal transduction histidine kinase
MMVMQSALRFRRRLTAAGISLLLLLFVAFGQAYRSVKRADQMNFWEEHTHEVLQEMESLRLSRAAMRDNFLAFWETSDPRFQTAFDARRQHLEETLKRLRALTSDNPGQERLLDRLNSALSDETHVLENAMHEYTGNGARKRALSQAFALAIPTAENTQRMIDQIEATESGLYEARSMAVAQSAHLALGILLFTGLLTVVILVTAGHLVQREIMKRAKVEVGLRRAQEILGVRIGEQRSELDHVVEDLHAQIHARNSAEQELQRLNEELETRVETRTAELQELNRELEAFTYSVSHDLRAPLRHMDGFSKILQQEFGQQLPDEAQHYLNRIRSAATHMSALVEDLLHLSRIGRQPPRRQLTSLRALAEQAREEVEPETQGREIAWKIGPLPDVEADPVLLRQVFVNLFSNAVKFTRKTPHAVIEVKASRQNGKVHVFVRDNGAGFDPRYADKLFGVFQRLHRQDEYEGTGIGLATIQRIIHKHGGRVWAESELGHGATFQFTLPSSGRGVQSIPDSIGATA